jgi:hypothetical protein
MLMLIPKEVAVLAYHQGDGEDIQGFEMYLSHR